MHWAGSPSLRRQRTHVWMFYGILTSPHGMLNTFLTMHGSCSMRLGFASLPTPQTGPEDPAQTHFESWMASQLSNAAIKQTAIRLLIRSNKV